MSHLFLIRRAETEMAGRFCGHSDPELNERGCRQLAGLVDTLSQRPIREVYSSDLRRARQTAEAFASHFATNIHLRPALREINFGLWEGLSWHEVEARDPLYAKRWAAEYPNSTAPEGESFQHFASRVRSEIAFLLEKATTCPIAAVTHAGVIRVALTHFCKLSQKEAWTLTKDYASLVTLKTTSIRNRTAEACK